jgi:hypothetical protein
MAIDWNEADVPPTTVLELWERINRFMRSAPDYELLKGKKVIGGVAGSKFHHGREGVKPKCAFAKWAPGTSGQPYFAVTDYNTSTVTVVSNLDMVVDILVIFR